MRKNCPDCNELTTVPLAKVGIMALVDEATGYQAVRPEDELRHKFIECLVEQLERSEQAPLARWYAAIPMRFWEQVFRLLGTVRDEIVEDVDKMDGALAFVSRTVFRVLPEEIKEELVRSEPVKPDEELNRRLRAAGIDELLRTGNDELDKVFWKTEGLLRISDSLEEFEGHHRSVFDGKNEGQVPAR